VVEISNYGDVALARGDQRASSQVRSVRVKAIVDEPAAFLLINEQVSAQLGLRKLNQQRHTTLADGRDMVVEMAGPVELRCRSHFTCMDAGVLPGDEPVRLGHIALSSLRVKVENHKLTLDNSPLRLPSSHWLREVEPSEVRALPPHPSPLPPGEGATSPALAAADARRTDCATATAVPSPRGEGQGEGKRRAQHTTRSRPIRTPRPWSLSRRTTAGSQTKTQDNLTPRT